MIDWQGRDPCMCFQRSVAAAAAAAENTRPTHVGMGDKIGWTEETVEVEKSRVVTSPLFLLGSTC